MATELRPKKLYLVTLTQTVEVVARDEQAALDLGQLQVKYFGGDTEDSQAEELEVF